MRKKILLSLCLFLLCAIVAGTRKVYAPEPTINVYPSHVDVTSPGQPFTVDIRIANSPLMDFWAVNLTWNSAVLNIVNPGVSIVEGSFMKQGGRSTLFLYQDPIPGAIPDMSCGILSGASVSGDGVLVQITFTTLIVATNSPINLDVAWLWNMTSDDVWYPTLTDGTVTVVPEFPVSMLLPALMIATTAVVLIAKIKVFRKRQEYVMPPP